MRIDKTSHLALISASLLLFPALSAAATITVNSALDITADDGACTLREAITAANANLSSGNSPLECEAGSASGTDAIVFAIPGAGPHVIQTNSALPVVSTSLTIDGYSQPGATPNTISGLTDGFNADIRIVIDGSQSGTTSKPGLSVAGVDAVDVVIRGLDIRSFTSTGCCADSGIHVGNGAHNTRIIGNAIHHNKSRGIFAQSSNNSIVNLKIGGPDAEDRNVIHSNGNAGVSIGNCTSCRIENNWIGLRIDSGQFVAAANANGVEIGSAAAVVSGNWIAGNTYSGIRISSGSTQNQVVGNVIGGGIANGNGVNIESANASFPTYNTIAQNHIHDNVGVGIALRTSNANPGMIGHNFQGNFLGDNGGIEIDIGNNGGGTLDGVTANDPGDVDEGPNGRQNFPVLGAPVIANGLAQVPYEIDSPAGSYAIEFNFSTECDPSGHGPSGDMTTAPERVDGLPKIGTAQFPIGAIPEAGYITATATGSQGTSEFSACLPYVNNDMLFRDSFGD
jgi:CSLREA domain-containing protein